MADEQAELLAYYQRDEERDRLGRGVGRVEFARTVEIVERTLPPPPARVADIGGGPGRYVDWLSARGHDVVHRDIVPLHVEYVRAGHGDAVDTAVCDACDLDLLDESVDAVLLFGPLYHLRRREDRLRALQEATRVVRPGGHVYAAAISRWAARLDGFLVQRVDLAYPSTVDLISELERTGQMPPVHDSSFTGYSHRPAELLEEIRESGLEVLSLVGVEAIAHALADVDQRMDDPIERMRLLDNLRAIESVPELLGASQHLLVTAQRARGRLRAR